MTDVFPPRNLGLGDYWGRQVEKRLGSADKKKTGSSAFIKGTGRANDAALSDLARRARDIEAAFAAIPKNDQDSSYVSNFSINENWTTVATSNFTTPGDRSIAQISSYGHVQLIDTGSAVTVSAFQWPFDLSLVTSDYGWRGGGDFHAGIDFAGGAASAGSPVYATADGFVSGVGSDSGRGNWVNVVHPAYAITTRYFHFQSYPPVTVGQPVTKGVTLLGYVGNTGHSYGAHLHYEMYRSGDPRDPEGYQSSNPHELMALYGTTTSATYVKTKARLITHGQVSPEFETARITEGSVVRHPFFVLDSHNFSSIGGQRIDVQLQLRTDTGTLPANTGSFASLVTKGLFSV